MRTIFIPVSFLVPFVCFSQIKIKARTTHNSEDRRYFIHKMDSLLKNGDLITGEKYLSEKEVALLDKEFEVDFSFRPEPYKDMRRHLDESGYIVALSFLEKILFEFPQFERFVLTTSSTIEKKQIKIMYVYFDDNTIGFYNETKKGWAKISYCCRPVLAN